MIRHLILAISLALVACSNLPPLGDATCGNGVVDPGEDCDGPMLCVACRATCTQDLDCGSNVAAPRDGSVYRCGADDLCHAASGEFDAKPTVAQFPVLGFGITDVDGDRVGDAVGLSPSALLTRFGSSSTPLDRELESLTPKLTGPPAITHLDDGDSLDFVVPSVDGLVAYTTANGVVAPLAFAIHYAINTDPAMTVLEPKATFPIDDTHLGIIFHKTTQNPPASILVGGIVDVSTAGHEPTPFALCADDYNPDLFDPKDLDFYNMGEPRGVAIAFLAQHGGARELCSLELQPGNLVPPVGQQLVQPVILGQFSASDAMVHPTLANLDPIAGTCPSIVTSSGTQPPVALQRYTGANAGPDSCALVGGPTDLPTFLTPVDGTPVLVDGTNAIGRVPLDLPAAQGYGADALVSAGGDIYAFQPGAMPALVSVYHSDRAVDHVAFGDFDVDGATDAVLVSGGEPNVDVLYRDAPQGVRPVTFRRVREGTAAVPHNVVVGDFDGDGIADILYFEAPSVGHDHMEIAYGSHDGAAAAVEVAEFAQVIAAAPIQLADSNNPYGRVRDIAVAERRDPHAPPLVNLLHGATERAMIPFIDPRSGGPGAGLFTGVAAGHFLSPNLAGFSPPDLASIGVDFTAATGMSVSIWALQAAGVGAADAVVPGSTTSREIWTGDTWGFCSMPRPMGLPPFDLCLDNAYFLPWSVGDHDLYIGIDTVQGRAAAVELRATALDATYSPNVMTPLPPAQNPNGNAFKAIVAPLGGTPKLVLAGITGARACDVAADRTIACEDLVDQAGAVCTDASVGRVAPGTNEPGLVLLCDHTRVVRFDDVHVATKLIDLKLSAATLAVGDVTGDAVDDVLVCNGDQVFAFRQRTSSEVTAP